MTYVEQHTADLSATPDEAWAVVCRLGGDPELWTPGPLWQARGLLERLVGGPGHRIEGPGRPLRVGDALDFWRVVEVHPPTRLRVRAESLLPGTAHLEIAVRARGAGSELTVRTEFDPAGALGRAFWWAELPAHRVVFMLVTRRLAAMVDRP